MRYLRGYGVMRQDPDFWSKMFIGTVLVLTGVIIPIVGQAALMGWYTLTLRRELHGVPTPLPRLEFDFDYLGKLLGIGFKAFIVGFVWMMPVMFLMMTLGFCLYFGVFFAAGATGAAIDEGGSGLGGVAFLCIMSVASLLFFPIIVLLQMPGTVAVMRAEIADDMNAGFKFGEVMTTTKLVFRELFFGLLAHLFMSMLLGVVGMLCFCIGMYPAMVASQVARQYFLADIYRLAIERGAPAVPLGPPDVPPPMSMTYRGYPPGGPMPPGGPAAPPADPSGWPPTAGRG